MVQHFLLSAAARTLSLVRVARMTDDEAYEVFRKLRWQATKGEAVCPRCECAACYEFKTRRIFKCKGCFHQFTVTSSTIFASRKLPIRTYLLAIAISVNAVKGLSALQLGRDLDVQAKTTFVLAHKLRESMSADQDRYQPAAVWPPEIRMPPLPARAVPARPHRHYSLKTKVFTEYVLSTHQQMMTIQLLYEPWRSACSPCPHLCTRAQLGATLMWRTSCQAARRWSLAPPSKASAPALVTLNPKAPP